MSKYLDENGLLYLWSKIKSHVQSVITNLNLSGTYVAKETGKGLSTNDYTTEEKNKLSNIAAGAEVNVQSNWSESDNTSDAYIKNKPSIPSKTSDLTNDSGFITTSDIPEGAAASTTTPLVDGTASTGIELAFARGDHRHPTDTSRVEANDPITGATKTKITYDSKGLVTSGEDLTANDIPNLTLSKITDITATAAELNIMNGVTASTAELNILDGVTASTAELNYVDGVTSSIQTQLNSKADASSSVSTIAYGSNKITKTINGTTSDVVTAATIVTDGGGVLSSTIGAASGVCPLDANQKVPAANLPSYVDDVVEAYPRTGQTRLSSTWLATGSASGTVITPESGVIYVLMTAVTFTDPDASSSHSTDTITWPAGTEFRWGGTSYVKINDGGLSSMTNTEMDTATNNWT